MFASSRCRPQVASGTALGTGAPPSDLIWRVRAPPAEEHRPENALRYSTYVLGGVGTATPTSVLPSPMVVLLGNSRLGSTAVSRAEPPLRAAGLVHRTSRSRPSGCPNA